MGWVMNDVEVCCGVRVKGLNGGVKGLLFNEDVFVLGFGIFEVWENNGVVSVGLSWLLLEFFFFLVLFCFCFWIIGYLYGIDFLV